VQKIKKKRVKVYFEFAASAAREIYKVFYEEVGSTLCLFELTRKASVNTIAFGLKGEVKNYGQKKEGTGKRKQTARQCRTF
jgi:hypothetical protein